jgi:transposase-like protein
MPAGRPPKKSDLVDSFDAGNLERERLRIILQTLSGEVSVVEACELLDVSETRFHDLRTQALQAAVISLAPKPRGRPSKPGAPEEVQKLKEQVMDLELELQTQRVKTEIAVTMPHLLKDKPTKKKITKKKSLRSKLR